jgi:hypothetical protein
MLGDKIWSKTHDKLHNSHHIIYIPQTTQFEKGI